MSGYDLNSRFSSASKGQDYRYVPPHLEKVFVVSGLKQTQSGMQSGQLLYQESVFLYHPHQFLIATRWSILFLKSPYVGLLNYHSPKTELTELSQKAGKLSQNQSFIL